MNSTDLHQAKREMLTFTEKLTRGFSKPQKKFIQDMVYGLAKHRSPLLSMISRALEESDNQLSSTIKRLSRQATDFSHFHYLHQNYVDTLHPYVEDGTLVIVDNSDITKPYGKKAEALACVHDGSENKIETGYMSANMVIATPRTHHPIPLYSHLFSAAEEHFISTNAETYKGFHLVQRTFKDKRPTYVMDRGYDTNDNYEYLSKQKADWIVRLKDNRYLCHQNKNLKVPDLEQRRKGKISFSSTIKGKTYALKISHIAVRLPKLKKEKLNRWSFIATVKNQ